MRQKIRRNKAQISSTNILMLGNALSHTLLFFQKKTHDHRSSMQVHSKQDSPLSKQSLYKTTNKPTNGNLV